MMLDAVTFDLGCARSPLFVFPEASGLAPLTLPDEFLHGQSHQQQPELSPDSVRRFETAMSTEQKLPPSVVESLMVRMMPESRKVEGLEVEGPKVKSPTVAEPEVASPKAKSPTVEGLKGKSRKSEIASVGNPMPVVSAERPRVVTADTVVHEDFVVRSADKRPVVASPAQPKIQVVVAPQAEPTIAIEKTPVKPTQRPIVATVERPVVVSADKPVVSIVDRPTVVTVEVPTVATVEKPMTAVPVERPAVETVTTRVHEGSVVRSAAERPVVASPELSKIQVIETTPKELIVPTEKTSTQSADKPVVSAGEVPRGVTVERPNASAVEVPKVVTVERSEVPAVEVQKSVAVERPVVVTADNPMIVTIERPVLPPIKHTVVPAVVENLNSRVESDEQLEAARSIPATPTTPVAPSAKPVAMVETPVVLDKPIGTSGERPDRVVVEGSSVALTNTAIQEGSVARSAVERPVVESPKQPTIQVIAATPEEPIGIFKEPPTISADKPVVSAVEVPKVVVVERTEVPAVEAPRVVAVERPVVAAVEVPKVVTVERPEVSAIEVPKVVVVERPEVPAVEAPRVVTVERPVVSAVEAPKVVTVERTEVPAVEAPRVVAVERPVVSAVEAPKVVAVERPEVPAVEVPMVVAVERPVVATADNPTIVTIERPVIAVADKPVISAAEHPSIATVGVPMAATVEKPVQADSTVVPIASPAIVENPVNRVKVEEPPVVASNTPIAPDAPATKPVARVEAPVVAVPVEPNGIIEKTPIVPAERPVAAKVSNPTVTTVDKPEEKALAASAHVVVAPAAVEPPAPQVLQASPEVAAASAASARTEVIVETVNQIVEAVVGQILVTPGITHGECEIKIMLKPTVLDGSEVTMSAKDGALTVSITPATQEASAAAASALPRLEIALAEHAPTFHHVSVALQLKKGNRNEAV